MRPALEASAATRLVTVTCLAFGLVALGSAPLRAQGVPVAGVAGQVVTPQINPGTLSDEADRQRLRLEQQHISPLKPQDDPLSGPELNFPKRYRPGQGPHFQLNGVTFDASALLKPAQLADVAKRFVGKTVDFAQLESLLAAVNQLYKAQGAVTANATLPPQHVRNGIVHIGLVEGRLGKAIPEGNAHTNKDFILDRLSARPGQVIDAPRLSRDLTYFNRTNDISLRALLVPGASFGQTDIRLAVEEPKINVLDVFVDNEGGHTTNRNETGLLFQRTGLLGIDDRLTLYGTAAQGSLNGSASYTMPVDVLGDRVGVSYQRNHIRVVQGPFNGLHVTGNSATADVNFTHPFVATRNWLLTGIVAFADTTSSTREEGTAINDDDTRKGTAGLALSRYGENSTITITQNVGYGSNHSSILHTSQDLLMFDGSLSAFERLTDRISLVSQAAWQYAPQHLLPSAELFEIGGPTTVRGYSSSGLAGNDGYYASLEAHRAVDLLQGADAYVFADRGTVYSPLPKALSLQTVGAGASVNFLKRFTASVTLAVPVLHTIPGQRDVRCMRGWWRMHFDAAVRVRRWHLFQTVMLAGPHSRETPMAGDKNQLRRVHELAIHQIVN